MDCIYLELEKKLYKLTVSLNLLSLKLDSFIKEAEEQEDYKMCAILLRYQQSLTVKIVLEDLVDSFNKKEPTI